MINGYLKICQLLLENGADINEKNHNGSSAFILSAENEQIEIIKYLENFI